MNDLAYRNHHVRQRDGWFLVIEHADGQALGLGGHRSPMEARADIDACAEGERASAVCTASQPAPAARERSATHEVESRGFGGAR